MLKKNQNILIPTKRSEEAKELNCRTYRWLLSSLLVLMREKCRGCSNPLPNPL